MNDQILQTITKVEKAEGEEDLIEKLVDLTEELEDAATGHYYEKEEYQSYIDLLKEDEENTVVESINKDPLTEADVEFNMRDMDEAGIRVAGALLVLEEAKAELEKFIEKIKNDDKSILELDEYKDAIGLLREINEGNWKPDDWEDDSDDEEEFGMDENGQEAQYVWNHSS
ncbi:uncharacterized protein L201_003729 [Kwoniella dendrophila CBS 6074]|uniref:Uncharacterized protein n=1 Tax=Kwoniella dendrophila CBS 6074 TaxID=1295534 RepID=A0AAX4JTR4_9TREE